MINRYDGFIGEFNMSHTDIIQPGITGHLIIKDKDTGEIILDKHNAIHFENMALTITRALANRADGHIHEMHFGNGGSNISHSSIIYLPPNVIGRDANLYNPTYKKVVDSNSSLNANSLRNNIEVKNLAEGLRYSDLVITCTLDYQEPAGQYAYDDAQDMESDYVFDEIGLKSFSPLGAGRGLLLTHVIFSPILKSRNRAFEILYYIRIAMN